MSTATFAFPVRLSEKYRPRRIADFVGLDRPKRIATKFVAHPYDCSFLFYGPPGVGKTTLAQAMAEEMRAEFHHIGSQKCTLEELERVCRRILSRVSLRVVSKSNFPRMVWRMTRLLTCKECGRRKPAVLRTPRIFCESARTSETTCGMRYRASSRNCWPRERRKGIR